MVTSAVSFAATEAETYLIAVDGFNDGGTAATGSITLTINRPTINSISPASGSVGSTVTITGTNFDGVTAVAFGDQPAITYTVDTPSQITATVPETAVNGPVTVTTPAGTATSATSFTLPAPTVTSFTPANGPAGTSVTITGTDFLGATAVTFNGSAASFTVNTATQITATVPSGATTGTISVTTAGGTGTSAASFTVPGPIINSFTPAGGPVGTSVTITGTDFSGVTSLAFNGTAASFTVNTSTQITATVPSGATPGPISVTGLTGSGASTTDFVVIRVSAISPASGRPGSIVTISGSGFTGATSVSIGGVATTFLADSDERVTAVIPTGGRTGAIGVSALLGSVASAPFTVLLPATTAIALSGTTFSPKAPVAAVAAKATWSFKGPGTHSVVDTSGLKLFSSGKKAAGTTFTFGFPTAGTYAYRDGASSGTGSVGVRPIVAARADGKIDVVVSSVLPPPGHAFDIQVQTPNTTGYVPWQTGVTSRLVRFTPGAEGTYKFVARLRNTTSNAATGWSPPGVASTGHAAYLTLMFGRTNWQAVARTGCQPLPGAVPLDQVSAALVARGLRATGAVVVNRTRETTNFCDSFVKYPSWQQLAQLRDQDGWTFVSAGTNYTDVTQLTPEQQQANTCGSLPTFVNHGHLRAWGMYAYPNDKSNATVQSNVVSNCFSYGRKYGQGSISFSNLTSPWFQVTNTINGGPCNDNALPCYNYPAIRTRRYMPPTKLGTLMNPGTDVWSTVQMYRLVTGAYANEDHKWDCTSPDWRAHWTNQHELYCFNDYLMALDTISPHVVVTDPATVATSWGRGF